MNRWNLLQAIAILLCVAAAYISYNLLEKHITGTSGVAWFENVCKDAAAAGPSGCEVVLASPYAYWPPKKDPDSKQPHVPVAFLGLLYFSTLGVWLLGVGRPSAGRAWIHILPAAMVTFGLMGSAYFVYIMFTKLEDWCPWCLVTHISNLVVAASVFWMYPREKLSVAPRDGNDGEVAPPPRPVETRRPYPSARVACTTLLAMVLVLAAEAQMIGKKSLALAVSSYEANYNACKAAVERLSASGNALYIDWNEGPTYDIAIRDDDPIRTDNPSAGPHWSLVVFGDFECPSCGKFARFLEREIQPLFDGRLNVHFKHFPLDPKCNKHVRLPTHPHACQAAAIAEGARLVGGNDAFWRAHDYLFENRDTIRAGSMTPEAVASAIQVDPERLREAMSSASIQERIDGDATQAVHCKLTGTPGVVLEGKKVYSLAAMEVGFWDKVADALWKQSGTPRPAHTRLSRAKATPGIPVPVNGP